VNEDIPLLERFPEKVGAARKKSEKSIPGLRLSSSRVKASGSSPSELSQAPLLLSVAFVFFERVVLPNSSNLEKVRDLSTLNINK
jgi:hypothetical protein